MRTAAFALVFLVMPAAAAPAPHGPGCALSTRECVRVAQELAIGAEMNAEDARTFGLDLPPYPRSKALLRREFDRYAARRPLLPRAIADEVSRIRFCLAKDEEARSNGAENTEPECR